MAWVIFEKCRKLVLRIPPDATTFNHFFCKITLSASMADECEFNHARVPPGKHCRGFLTCGYFNTPAFEPNQSPPPATPATAAVPNTVTARAIFPPTADEDAGITGRSQKQIQQTRKLAEAGARNATHINHGGTAVPVSLAPKQTPAPTTNGLFEFQLQYCVVYRNGTSFEKTQREPHGVSTSLFLRKLADVSNIDALLKNCITFLRGANPGMVIEDEGCILARHLGHLNSGHWYGAPLIVNETLLFSTEHLFSNCVSVAIGNGSEVRNDKGKKESRARLFIVKIQDVPVIEVEEEEVAPRETPHKQ